MWEDTAHYEEHHSVGLDLDCGRAEKVGLGEAERVKALVTLPGPEFEPQDPHSRKEN